MADRFGLPINNSDPKVMQRFGVTLEDYYTSLGIEVHSSGGGNWGINGRLGGTDLVWFGINYKVEELLPEPDSQIYGSLYTEDGLRLDRNGPFECLADLLEALKVWEADYKAGLVCSAETGEVVTDKPVHRPRM